MPRQKYCPYCGNLLELPPQYPNPSPQCAQCNCLGIAAPRPVVLVLVYKGVQLLLGRSPRHKKGAYALLPGHVELGESAEQTAQREVLEESGVKCNVTHYMGSFSLEGRQQLCLTFAAQYQTGEVEAADDVEDVRWFDIGA